ncbi:M20/M25/M40 family metallo-hydrolase [Bacteroides salyersiae]|nr:M20/M25/M40 family metallo-hydrolase [Bacteroides salyersiae]
MKYDVSYLTTEAVSLLKSLIAIPSVSREEAQAADHLQNYIEAEGMTTGRKGNNIWCLSPMFDLKKPTILLNSHIDTVKPVNGWRKDPFTPREENGKLYGLGSNDAGASVVTLLQVFLQLCRTQQSYNLIYLASCEEEVSGKDGIESVLKRTSSHLICHRGRTDRNATCHCRKRSDGAGCDRYRKSRTCRP